MKKKTNRNIGHQTKSIENPTAVFETFSQYGRRRFLHGVQMIGKTTLKTAMALTAAALFTGSSLAAAKVTAVTAPTNVSASSTKPDIVYILADDMAYGDVSSFNPGDKIQTPNIDRIGHEGMIFTDAQAASAVCTPSRYGLLTGRYPWRSRLKAGLLWGLSPHLIEPGRMTVASLLKSQGYNTAMIGKWHLGVDWQFKKNNAAEIHGHASSSNTYQFGPLYTKQHKWMVDYSKNVLHGPLTNGFDYDDFIPGSADMWPWIYIRNDHPVGVATNKMTVNEQLMGAPYARTGPAAPYYKPVDVLPDFTNQACSYIRKQAAAKHPFFLYYAMPAPPTPIAVLPAFQGKSPLHFGYLDYCIETDAIVGKVLKAIRDAGISKNTLVIFTSDNGFAPYVDPHLFLERHGDYPSYIFRGFKSDIWEGGTRVPFLVRWPGVIKAGGTNSDLICLTDLMATVADILHVTLPQNAGEDSFSLLPAFKGEKFSHPVVTASDDGSLSIHDGRWKLEMCSGSGGWSLPNSVAQKAHLPLEQLYDMRKVPIHASSWGDFLHDMNAWQGITEKLNVAGQYPSVVRRLRRMLAQYVRDGRSTPGKPQHNDAPQIWPAINWIKSVGHNGSTNPSTSTLPQSHGQ